jgi:hypothetical protein
MRRAASRREIAAVFSPRNGKPGCNGKRVWPDKPTAD